jgi:hypothetical protein
MLRQADLVPDRQDSAAHSANVCALDAAGQ